MLFNSKIFILFLPLFLFLYYLTKGKKRLLVCLAGSYLFYGWWDVRFLLLIALMTVANYSVGPVLVRKGEDYEQRRKQFIILTVCFNLVILGFFKYFNFFLSSAQSVLSLFNLSSTSGSLKIILPVGISFYTFQTMSYSIDVYRGKLNPEKSLLNFSVFVSFFPQLVAGPIVRAADFLPQLKEDKTVDPDSLLKGLQFILWGYFLKCGVADSLSAVVDSRFANPVNHNSFSLLIGVIFYGFQIYADFAGYSLIAIGLAKIMGFEFLTNFRRPYLAASFTDFWKRWHISLSSWLRDYLYISLGGNRKGKARSHINRFVTMLLGGLWHGANWTFVFWGFLHGSFLLIENGLLSRIKLKGIATYLYRVVVLVLVFLAWVFFRAESFFDAFYICSQILNLRSYSIVTVPLMFQVIKGFVLIVTVIIVDSWIEKGRFDSLMGNPVLTGLCSGILLVYLTFWGTFGESAFIYFQF